MKGDEPPDETTEAKLAVLSQEIGETRDIIASSFRRLDVAEGLDESWAQKLLRFANEGASRC